MLDLVREERERVVARMWDALNEIKLPVTTSIALRVVIIFSLAHTFAFLLNLTMAILKIPFVVLKFIVLLPAVMIYAWLDGLVMVGWFYKQLVKEKK